MKRTVKANPMQCPDSHPSLRCAEPNTASQRRPSEQDQRFIQEMNEFVEKHGTITDDEFYRVI